MLVHQRIFMVIEWEITMKNEDIHGIFMEISWDLPT